MRRPCVLVILSAAALVCTSQIAAAADVSAWFAPGAHKIMRDARPGAGSPQKWDLAAARNEVESCQLVLLADGPVHGVIVTASDLKSTKDKGSLKPALFKVEYVPIWEERTLFPDPLPPLAQPLDLQPGQAQPVWISVRVPAEAVPGNYHGTVRVTAGKWAREFPLSVRVWDFALPVTPTGQTAFGLDYSGVAEFHGVAPDSPKARELNRKYYEFLLDHRISPYNIPVDLMSKDAVPYLEDPRMTSYNIPVGPKTDEELKALVDHLIDGGWFAKGYFYEVDEPITKDAFNALVSVTDRLRRIEPRSRVVTPFWGNPDFDSRLRSKDVMLGRVAIWCPITIYLESEPGFPQFLTGRKNAGDTIWWYVCGGILTKDDARAVYNNLDIPLGAMNYRTFGWQQKKAGIQGMLYWNTTYWHKKYTEDPWQNTVTLEPRKCGDGMLLYPGAKIGIDGPVTSLRLEVLRDSLEDFDFLTLADQRLGREVTMEYVHRVVKTLSDYERDPMKLEEVRRELGNALEKATVEARRKL